ncbi:hypothetical protein [Acetivibrio straminisolvens]|nr:hypothetical protein [Acetivibrio straminisolvens]
MQAKDDEYKVFIDFGNDYNDCFCSIDIEKLKRFYDCEMTIC